MNKVTAPIYRVWFIYVQHKKMLRVNPADFYSTIWYEKTIIMMQLTCDEKFDGISVQCQLRHRSQA